jgi:hypothetical protein
MWIWRSCVKEGRWSPLEGAEFIWLRRYCMADSLYKLKFTEWNIFCDAQVFPGPQETFRGRVCPGRQSTATVGKCPRLPFRAEQGYVKVNLDRTKRIKCVGIGLPTPREPLHNHEAIWGGPQGRASIPHHSVTHPVGQNSNPSAFALFTVHGTPCGVLSLFRCWLYPTWPSHALLINHYYYFIVMGLLLHVFFCHTWNSILILEAISKDQGDLWNTPSC